jgi:hypothetical protein
LPEAVCSINDSFIGSNFLIQDSPADKVLSLEKNHKNKIESRQLGEEIPNRLADHEQEEKQNHAGIRGEQVLPLDQRLALLALSGRNPLAGRRGNGSF